MKVKTVEEIPQDLTSRDVLFMRTLLETRGSFRSFELWAAACDGESTGPRKVNRCQCAKGLQTMVALERALTLEFLMEASACHLQADGLGRIYQVEMGMVLWKYPRWGSWLLQPGIACPGLLQLGDRGPWLVDRLTGARDRGHVGWV